MRTMLIRPLQLTTLGFALILIAALSIMGVLAWNQNQDLKMARSQIRRLHASQLAFLKMEGAIGGDDGADPTAGSASALMQELLAEVNTLIALGGHVRADTPRKLNELRELLQGAASATDSVQLRSLRLFSEIVSAESKEQELLLHKMAEEAQAEWRLAVAALIVLAGLGLLILLAFRKRILGPLHGLKLLVSRLAQGEFAPVPVERVDPMLNPLFNNYNQMVMRLEELEQEHRARADSLKQEVRAATTALLEQQRGLARAERLAATGELAASVAHELRNPLAGIQLALGNLRRDLDDPDMTARLDLVIGEMQRLVRLLNELLSMSRHAPEVSRSVNLMTLIRQLLTLTRYQLPPGVLLEEEVPENLVCHLPEDRLRQTLLNLILNASQAFEGGAGTVHISADTDQGTLRVTVADNGPGFGAEALRNAPRPFFSTHETGTGLGLALVHRFARDLGGRVELANSKPRGAAVTLILPDCVSDA